MMCSIYSRTTDAFWVRTGQGKKVAPSDLKVQCSSTYFDYLLLPWQRTDIFTSYIQYSISHSCVVEHHSEMLLNSFEFQDLFISSYRCYFPLPSIPEVGLVPELACSCLCDVKQLWRSGGWGGHWLLYGLSRCTVTQILFFSPRASWSGRCLPSLVTSSRAGPRKACCTHVGLCLCHLFSPPLRPVSQDLLFPSLHWDAADSPA